MISKSSFVRRFGGVVLAAALPSSLALAHGDAKSGTAKTDTTQTAAPATSLEGTVQAVTHKDLTVKDTAGNTMKVELSKQTHYDNSGKSGAMKDLRPGMSVTIQGQKQKDGTLRATAVRYDKNAPVETQPT
jgi:hypothetical protein